MPGSGVPGLGISATQRTGDKRSAPSYASTLAARDGMICRQNIGSPWYQRLRGQRFKLRDDQNQKNRFDNL